jgi:hypothetical protein
VDEASLGVGGLLEREDTVNDRAEAAVAQRLDQHGRRICWALSTPAKAHRSFDTPVTRPSAFGRASGDLADRWWLLRSRPASLFVFALAVITPRSQFSEEVDRYANHPVMSTIMFVGTLLETRILPLGLKPMRTELGIVCPARKLTFDVSGVPRSAGQTVT